MTFIEVLIAVIIVGIILSSMLACLNFAGKYIRHNANKTMALNYGQALMEEIQNVPYGGLDSYNGYTDTVQLYQKEDVDIEAVRTAVVLAYDAYKKITVTISWDLQGRPYEEEINTLRYNYE